MVDTIDAFAASVLASSAAFGFAGYYAGSLAPFVWATPLAWLGAGIAHVNNVTMGDSA